VFIDRVREVGGLKLETPVAALLKAPKLPSYVPLLFHGSARVRNLSAPAVAMSLFRFFDKAAECRFGTREDVVQAFKFVGEARVLLSGVAQDREVERWWKLEAKGRMKAIANLRRLGISLVTTPNFSLMVDRPRWDDLHSMRRIASVYHELVSEGQPAALHLNGRTQEDFSRWTEYVAAHPEVTHVAYEFTTGAKNLTRMHQHVRWLIDLAKGAGRRLSIVLRGGVQVIPHLSKYFDIIFIDTSPFEKAQHRELALINADGQRRWIKRMTPHGVPIDDLFHENVRTSEHWFASVLPKLALAA
jgi:hypothetical protein